MSIQFFTLRFEVFNVYSVIDFIYFPAVLHATSCLVSTAFQQAMPRNLTPLVLSKGEKKVLTGLDMKWIVTFLWKCVKLKQVGWGKQLQYVNFYRLWFIFNDAVHLRKSEHVLIHSPGLMVCCIVQVLLLSWVQDGIMT